MNHGINTGTKNGILMAITGPTPLKEGTSRHLVEPTISPSQPHTITIPTRKARTRLFIRRLLIYELVVTP
ncbi:hypothetical protein AVEN_204567-1, partial [Araneus ventricosus]